MPKQKLSINKKYGRHLTELESEYLKARANLYKRVNRLKKKGFDVNMDIIPSRKVKPTKELVKAMNSMKQKEIIARSERPIISEQATIDSYIQTLMADIEEHQNAMWITYAQNWLSGSITTYGDMAVATAYAEHKLEIDRLLDEIYYDSSQDGDRAKPAYMALISIMEKAFTGRDPTQREVIDLAEQFDMIFFEEEEY